MTVTVQRYCYYNAEVIVVVVADDDADSTIKSTVVVAVAGVVAAISSSCCYQFVACWCFRFCVSSKFCCHYCC